MDFVENLSGVKIPDALSPLPFLLIFGYFVYQGTQSVDLMNRLLMIGLAITYAILVFYVTPHVKSELLNHSNWAYFNEAVSVLAVSFGFHIIPISLVNCIFLDFNNPPKLIF